jgi:hypothetical protein
MSSPSFALMRNRWDLDVMSSERFTVIFRVVEDFELKRPADGFTRNTFGDDVWTLKETEDEDLLVRVKEPSFD